MRSSRPIPATIRPYPALMRTLGLIGGMSWESSAEYYRLINRGVRDACGPTASAQVLLWSFNFAEIEVLLNRGDWAALGTQVAQAARALHAGGAEVLLLCTNSVHICADAITAATPLPLLHIADPLGAAIRAQGLSRVGLLGTRFTMEQPFLRDRLAQHHGIATIVPDAPDRDLVHRVIFDELVAGKVEPASRAAYAAVIARLVDAGAQAVVLGCTELMLLVRPEDSAVPLFDTTALHTAAAIALALG